MDKMRTAREGEVYGIIVEMLGASRVRARCEDAKMRVCRIPGKLRKKIWMREGDVVILKPWEGQEDRSADVIWRFTSTETSGLRRRGELDKLDSTPGAV